MKKYSQKELIKRVSEVLYYALGPNLCIYFPLKHVTSTKTMCLQIVGILERSDDAQELAKLLSKIRTKSMGLPENISKDLETAELLQDHKNALIQFISISSVIGYLDIIWAIIIS